MVDSDSSRQTAKWRKARKKPIIVDVREVVPNAFDYERSATHYSVEVIKTREGELLGYPEEDYIICGIEGEIYPIKKNIFHQTYKLVYDSSNDTVKMEDETC